MLDAALYCKKLKQVHRKTDPEKLERCGNKPSAISQSDDHISMLSRVNKKDWQVPRKYKKIISEDDWLQIKTPVERHNLATHTCTVHNTTFTVINPNYLDTKKNWIKGTKLLKGNPYSLPLDFFPNITCFSCFLERQNPDFFSIFQLPIFVEQYRQPFTNVGPW